MHHRFEKIIDFVLPPLCVHCQHEGGWLCAAARSEVAAIPVLADPLIIDGVDRVFCRGDYDLPLLGNIIQRVKYDFLIAPARGIFPIMLEKIEHDVRLLPDDAVIVPVPLHWRRQMSRGFNQSNLIAQTLSEITGRPVRFLLQRRRFTTPQAKLKSEERATNVAEAFRLAPKATMPKAVVLVDDVITTGSTIKECATALRDAGVQKIIAVALAKG